jgi:drug/metabolite transporter (DMT)-like permease
MGWSMLLAGILFTPIHAPWHIEGTWDFEMYSATIFIILFGSVFAFYAYLTALTIIGSQKTSVLASAEPLSAALISIFWLGVDFTLLDAIGTLLIISAIFLLTKRSRN